MKSRTADILIVTPKARRLQYRVFIHTNSQQHTILIAPIEPVEAVITAAGHGGSSRR